MLNQLQCASRVRTVCSAVYDCYRAIMQHKVYNRVLHINTLQTDISNMYITQLPCMRRALSTCCRYICRLTDGLVGKQRTQHLQDCVYVQRPHCLSVSVVESRKEAHGSLLQKRDTGGRLRARSISRPQSQRMSREKATVLFRTVPAANYVCFSTI